MGGANSAAVQAPHEAPAVDKLLVRGMSVDLDVARINDFQIVVRVGLIEASSIGSPYPVSPSFLGLAAARASILAFLAFSSVPTCSMSRVAASLGACSRMASSWATLFVPLRISFLRRLMPAA